jgi:uncharacterized RDD family membrane protein YckC
MITAFMKIAALPDNADSATGQIMSSAWLWCSIANLIYYTIFECTKQATPGKMCLGLEVTDIDGKKLGFWRALARNLGKYLSGLPLYFGYLMAGFTQRKQALHDKMARCLVVRKHQSKETKWSPVHHKHGTSWPESDQNKTDTISAVPSTAPPRQTIHAGQISTNTTDGAQKTPSPLPSQSTRQPSVEHAEAFPPQVWGRKVPEPLVLPEQAVAVPISETTNSLAEPVALAVIPEMQPADISGAGASGEPPAPAADETCRSCGTTLDKNFSFCLQCSTPREG